jgi:hypothetical protein
MFSGPTMESSEAPILSAIVNSRPALPSAKVRFRPTPNVARRSDRRTRQPTRTLPIKTRQEDRFGLAELDGVGGSDPLKTLWDVEEVLCGFELEEEGGVRVDCFGREGSEVVGGIGHAFRARGLGSEKRWSFGWFGGFGRVGCKEGGGRARREPLRWRAGAGVRMMRGG